MLIIDSSKYNDYLINSGVENDWKKRDFVEEVEKYMDCSLNKVLLVSGLRGTGKTIGVLQAMQNRNAVYIAMEQGITSTADELMKILASRPEKIIVLDEYTWLSGRKNSEIDGYLYTLVNHGKRVIVTGANLINAFDKLEVMEYSAKAIVASESLGEIVAITDEEVADLRKAFNF